MKLVIFLLMGLLTLLVAAVSHADDTIIVQPSAELMESLKAAAADNELKKAVIVFMNETAKTNAVVEDDGAIQVGRELQKPYKIQGTILSEVKPAREGFEISFHGNLNGLNRADMKVNSGLVQRAAGPSPTQILFKGIQPETLQNARATFVVTPSGVSLKTLEPVK